MKTTADIHDIIPSVMSFIKSQELSFGDYYENETETNRFIYEKGDWAFEIEFECTGISRSDSVEEYCFEDLVKGWGELTELTCYYTDPETNEEHDFEDEEIKPLVDALEEYLKDLV